MMKIKLTDVNNTTKEKYRFNLRVPANEIDFATDDYRVDGLIEVDGTVENVGDAYRLQGNIRCRVKFICDCCLEDGQIDQLHTFDEEETPSSNEFIDLTSLVRDIIVADQPITKLCKPDCKGLCPKCGANLNLGDCGCDRRSVDVRLAVLKKLLKKD